MRRPLRPWLLVVPLGTLGVLTGHEIAYALTSTPHDELHGYLSHLPQVALLLSVLALVGASFVERGRRLALWPFPAVAIAGFVVQEHVERVVHDGSVPFLFDRPFFLVGLAVQVLVAVAAWLLARLLVRLVGSPARERRDVGDAVDLLLQAVTGPVGGPRGGLHCPRAPPLIR